MQKIYCFMNGQGPCGGPAIAIAEDGHIVGSHFCSNEGWAKEDLYSDHHQEEYKKHYPEGYELEFVRMSDLANHKGLQEALRRNNETV